MTDDEFRRGIATGAVAGAHPAGKIATLRGVVGDMRRAGIEPGVVRGGRPCYGLRIGWAVLFTPDEERQLIRGGRPGEWFVPADL